MAALVPLALLIVPIVLAIMFVPAQWRLECALVLGALVATSAGYVIGRMRSRLLPDMLLAERMATMGRFTFTSPYARAAALLGLISLIVLLLPGQFGQAPTPAPVDTKGEQVTNPLTMQEVPFGQVRRYDDRLWSAEPMPSLAAKLTKDRPAPSGFRWVAFYIEVLPRTEDAEFFAGSVTLRLLDDTNRVYLPEYGKGIFNAKQTYVRQEHPSFWQAAYQIPAAGQVRKIQMELYPSVDRLIEFRPQTLLDTCQAQQKRTPAALSAKCQQLLSSQEVPTSSS